MNFFTIKNQIISSICFLILIIFNLSFVIYYEIPKLTSILIHHEEMKFLFRE